MARRPVDHHAICCALAATAVLIATRPRTRSGNITPHSSACMPPIDPPTTASHWRTPSALATATWLRTMSRIDTTGKLEPYGVRVVLPGCREDGPVLPWQPPSTLAQTTK